MFRVLVVDDDANLRLSVAEALSANHYQVDQASDGEEAVNRVRAGQYDLVLLDVNMPKMSGIEALREIKAFDPSIIAIVLTAFSNVSDAVEATKQGAYNYLEKPVKAENLVYMIDRALRAHRMVKNMTFSAPTIKLPDETEFVGQSSEMKKVFSVIEKLARVDTAVLIRGESGTGKELVATALHFNGPRKDNRFVTINCSAIPENLIESELFGHEKGAFTGADARKIGKFQFADGGTLFLDEIGDISAAMQVKLLRALQQKKFTPVGSNREIEVNVRIIAATNRNLEEMIKNGEFREDLFYRLNVLPINLPPLRDRATDLEALSTYFVDKFNVQYQKSIRGLGAAAKQLMESHRWPGNIRELENAMEHAFVIETEDEITPDSLPEYLTKGQAIAAAEKPVEKPHQTAEVLRAATTSGGSADAEARKGFSLNIEKLDFQANKEEFERQFLISALKNFKGRINQTALHANIPKKTLLRKLEKYGINARDYT
jgi:two-component system response regulator HydG